MEHVKRPVCIALFLCSSAVMACNKENTIPGDWRENVDPVDMLSALETAQGADRARIQERLGLIREAIHSWDEIAREDSGSSKEAADNRDRLQRLPDPLREWNPDDVERALDRNDTAALTKMVRAFPADAARLFEKSDLRDRVRARRLATSLADAGEHYPMAVVEAMERARNPKALEQGLAAFRNKDYLRAVTLLERADNPLHLAARYYAAVPNGPISLLDATLPHLKPEYRELASRIHMWRANLLEFDNRYLEAHADYDRALAFAKGEPTATARILGSRSVNYAFIGGAEAAFRDAHRAVRLLPRVADTNARNTANGAAAAAATQLGHPLTALHYQNAAVEDVQRSVIAATTGTLARAKKELVAALRARAGIHVELGRNADAEGDLARAADLAEAVELPLYRDLFRMRIREVQGQTLLQRKSPAGATAAFSQAIDLAKKQDSTYRAMLHFKRATARRKAGDRQADDDTATAMNILRDEVRGALATNPEVASRPLWEPYFSRFREMHHQLIESRIVAGDVEGAFVYAELARAFEPMQILLQSGSVPPGFRPVETVADLRQARATLPEDTVILQYLVLPDKTFTWVVTRERVILVRQRAKRDQVKGWVAEAIDGVAFGQRDPFIRAMRAAYAELFREPLKLAGAKTRIVIVPDEPMHGLPFNGLVGTAQEGYLIERASIANAGSTSLYLFALARDRQLSNDRNPPVLLVGDPAFDSKDFPRLKFAREEVQELARDYYRGAEVLTDKEATVRSFLAKAKNAGIIHFAGHGLASAARPWQSRLLLARHENESGELSAEVLVQKLPSLDRTRLVVLGACESAGGGPVGPQGLAPLVRPLIGARVPAVVGSLWAVGDASSKQLLVSLHCHYRHGDDVAVALRNAQLEQLERLRKKEPAMSAMQWAAFQVVGYAASPYPRSIALENPNSEHVCPQNSLHRPDGLHPQ